MAFDSVKLLMLTYIMEIIRIPIECFINGAWNHTFVNLELKEQSPEPMGVQKYYGGKTQVGNTEVIVEVWEYPEGAYNSHNVSHETMVRLDINAIRTVLSPNNPD